MAGFNNNKPSATTTHIRTLYSDGLSYLTITFFNNNLSFNFVPFMEKDSNGLNKYNTTRSSTTTVKFEGAAGLLMIAEGIINGTMANTALRYAVQCANNTELAIERKMDGNQWSTYLTITKDNNTIPFKFETKTYKVMENGQMSDRQLETGLAVIQKTIEGYLTGINAERHLNKLTEDFAKAQEAKGEGQGGYQKGNYNNQGGYKKPYNNNQGGYQKRPYNNNQGGYNNQNQNSNPPWEPMPSQSVGMSSFNPPE